MAEPATWSGRFMSERGLTRGSLETLLTPDDVCRDGVAHRGISQLSPKRRRATQD